MRIVGIDENGLGPQLGPLVTTAVSLELDHPYDASALSALGASVGIEDSKASSAFGHMARAEGIALALVERLCGHAPAHADALLDALTLDGQKAMRAPCPKRSAAQCWGEPVALPAFGGDLEHGRRAVARLAEAGVRPVRVRSAPICVRVFNRLVGELASKLAVDLHLFERLMLDARAASPTDIEVICGMVGGIRRYRDRFTLLRSPAGFGAQAVAVAEETRGYSSYEVEGLGRVVFEVDSDAHHLPVAAASMVGKYLRELSMERQNRFYRRHAPDLPAASGYHDPKTRAFVEASRPLRQRLAISEGCFIRQR